MFVIDPRDKAPLYEQLAGQLRKQIAMGILAADEPLPPVRQLAGELGINPNTIQKAYRQMESEGLTYSCPGRGSFVTPDVGAQRQRQQVLQLELVEREMKKALEMGVTIAALRKLTDSLTGAEEGDNC